MKRLNLRFDDASTSSFFEDLQKMNLKLSRENYIAAIAATRHHITGQLAFNIGCHRLDNAPAFTLRQAGDRVIALFMDELTMDQFENTTLSLCDGYVKIQKTS